MSSDREENPAIIWARTLVDALAAAGLRDVCLAPGSRSTPLVVAFHEHPAIRRHLQLDERSAGFLALGMAQASGRPVALVCTSGTAAANFFPAVIEAHMSQIPLIVLTADRPPELRHSGANQTIDQVKMYGDHVLWAVDLDVPTAGIDALARRSAAATAGRAFALAAGLRRGPVHLNVPFRKPLEPGQPGNGERGTGNDTSPTPNSQLPSSNPRFAGGTLMPGRDQIEFLVDQINRHERGLIICGPGCPGGAFPQAAAALARRAGYPLAADPLSGLRFGPWVDGETPLLAGYETLLAGGRPPDWADPDVVIRFGQVPTGKWLNQYLDGIAPAVRLHVRASGVWADDSHRTTHFWQVDEAALCQMVSSLIARGSGLSATPAAALAPAWLDGVMRAEAALWTHLGGELAGLEFDGGVVADWLDGLPDRANVMIGNSLPVRHVDQFARPAGKALRFFGNRGASGIDGIVSTAAGIALADPETPASLLIGDISFFHDQNGLLAARRAPNLKIILLHNDGGGIFRRLPMAAIDPPFTELFLTPHGLDFEPIARMHGLDFRRVDSRAAFREAWADQMAADGPAVLEYRSDSAADEVVRRALVRAVQEALA